jgi:hypothetical protein
MSFIAGTNRGQVSLLPPGVEDYVAPQALVRVVDAFVASLDLGELGFGRTGVTPGRLESLGAHYYMGNTKIATMFASHRASGKHRWAAPGDWTSWSDGGYLGANSENSQPSCGKNRA